MKQVVIPFLSSLALMVASPSLALAHVAVQPEEIGIGKFTTFTINVPTEKGSPTVSVKLLLPKGLTEVSPISKAGWQIKETKTGDGQTAEVTEIAWSEGTIPTDQRDEFKFMAQVPANATDLNWKTVQTYQDGSNVAWDQAPIPENDKKEGSNGPYAVTNVINDIKTVAKEKESNTVAFVALGLSVVAIILPFTKKKN